MHAPIADNAGFTRSRAARLDLQKAAALRRAECMSRARGVNDSWWPRLSVGEPPASSARDFSYRFGARRSCIRCKHGYAPTSLLIGIFRSAQSSLIRSFKSGVTSCEKSKEFPSRPKILTRGTFVMPPLRSIASK